MSNSAQTSASSRIAALLDENSFVAVSYTHLLYLSLSKYKLGMDGAEFIGLENYVKLAGSKLFWKVMKNTIVFALMTVIPSMAVGLEMCIRDSARIQVKIVSRRYEEINRLIAERIDCGTSLLHMETGYLHREQEMLSLIHI